MSDKPSYVKVLNAIAVGEARGHALFEAWAKATRDTELAATLRRVAIRECEHAAVFTKRLCELGYSVREKPAGDFETRLQKLRSDASDAEKFESVLGYGRERGDEGLNGIFADTTIDPLTGKLLGRFIAEERDTRRLLQTQYERVKAGSMRGETVAANGEAAATSGQVADAVLDDAGFAQISERLERLTRTIEELKILRQRR
jgi:hypothetical protein